MLKRILYGLFLVLLTLSLSSCDIRTRIIAIPDDNRGVVQSSTPSSGSEKTEAEESDAHSDEACTNWQANQLLPQEEPDANAQTKDDPLSQQREYDPNASAEITASAEQSLFSNDDTSMIAILSGTPDGQQALILSEAERKATELITQEEASQLGISEQAPRADTVYQYYRAMLDSRVNTLFECKRLYVYWETPTNGQTIHKSHPEHEVLRLAGCYDVAVKRQEDALLVDDGWVERKNPDAIIKCVDREVLGEGILTTARAKNAWQLFTQRSALRGTNAIRSGRVLFLSQQLMDSPAGQLGAALFIAKEMYPDLFLDLNPTQAIKQLYDEEQAKSIEGIFAYSIQEEQP